MEVASSATGTTMNSTNRRIKFDTKTIDLFWLMGFAVWRAIELYGPAVALAQRTGMSIDKILEDDEERPQLELDYKQRIAATKALLGAAATDGITWPSDIPKPTDDRDSLKDDQEKSAFDLVCLALAFALLHELRHVMFRKAGDAPEEGYEEEMACDTWARTTMTSTLAEYARDQGHKFAEVEQKRASGIALAAIVVHAMTSPMVRWGTDEYPPIADRLTAMIAGYSLPSNSNFWFFTACLLVALMRQERRPLDLSPASYKELVETLLGLVT
ncbi:hypothetical protein J3E64_003658 [Sphingobium sp. OAS761]|uniref:phage exclusion protein Lit family protein n=1 Tax=Sphingobium sp. OAS761 TaxID=2817901 RepID=UPI00209DACF1|nr:hypothetical protein [Sphingobium sp. OAS761]